MTAAERIISREAVPVRFTANEFMEMVRHPPLSEWIGKIELIDGEIVHMSPGNMPHWRIQQEASRALHDALIASDPSWAVGTEPTVRFSKRVVRIPDVGAFRSPKMTKKTIFQVADLFLAVEVADTSLRNDLGRKRVDHADAGVPHYWVVDVNGRKTHVMADPEAGEYGTRRVIPFGEPIPVPGTDATITVD